MIERIIIALATQLVAWIYQRVLDKVQKDSEKNDETEISKERKEKFEKAMKETFDGTAVTPEQRKKLNDAIRDFVRNPTNNSGL